MDELVVVAVVRDKLAAGACRVEGQRAGGVSENSLVVAELWELSSSFPGEASFGNHEGA